jgi:hypothetical protein
LLQLPVSLGVNLGRQSRTKNSLRRTRSDAPLFLFR